MAGTHFKCPTCMQGFANPPKLAQHYAEWPLHQSEKSRKNQAAKKRLREERELTSGTEVDRSALQGVVDAATDAADVLGPTTLPTIPISKAGPTLKTKKFCTHCGGTRKAEHKFCGFCGGRL